MTAMVDGMQLPGNVDQLRDAGNAAVAAKNFKQAAHLYTLAMDTLANAHGLSRDENGRASPRDLFACQQQTGGALSKLLSNRSLAHLRLGDDAAIDDAVACTHADPSWEKGHLRVLQALQAQGAPVEQQLQAVHRGIAACPEGTLLRMEEKKLESAAAAAAAAAAPEEEDRQEVPQTPPQKPKHGVVTPSSATGAAAPDDDPLAETRRVAEDGTDPRRFMALGDLGAAMAVGAHGVPRDAKQAEVFLRRGARGDVVAKRNLGLLLLDTGRPGEAAAVLSEAAQAGDEEAAATLAHLCQEAEAKQLQAREKLIQMASEGDARAAEILRELS